MLFEEPKKIKQAVDYEKFLVPPEIIKDSYQRCRDSRVRTELTKMPRVLVDIQVEDLLTNSELLLSAARPVIRQEMHPYFNDENQLIILCDSEAYALDLMSSPETLNMCYQKDLGQGSCFKEEVCGTNAIALALRLKNMVVVRGKQHYSKLFKAWSCIAAPIRSPSGDIIGCLDISMHSEENLKHTAALVQLAAKYVEKIYAEKMSAEMLPQAVASPELLSRFDLLSRREKEVFRFIAEGKTIGEIAKEIGIGVDTVKTHQKRLYKKMGARNKIDCLNKARELGQVIE